jgi:6-phosphogluconolactonase (cycloisomerase 2 family)
MTNLRSRLFAIASLSGLCLLASCGKFFVPENGGTGGTTCSTNCIFIGNYDTTAADADVADFAAVDPLEYVMATNVTLGDNPVSMAVTPSNDTLYVASADGNIYYYTIESGGSLEGVAAATTTNPVLLNAIAIDPTGAFLVAVGEEDSTTCTAGAATIEIFSIPASTSTSGALTLVSTTQLNACGAATAVAFAPDDNSVFVALGTLGIQGFAFSVVNSTDATITIPNAGYAVGSNADIKYNGLVVDSKSAYLFASASGTDGGAYSYTINASAGTLTTAGSVQDSGGALYPIAIDGTSTYVYTADINTGGVYGYTFGASGLTAIAGSPFSPSSTSSSTYGLATDSGGKYVFTVSEDGPNLQEYTIGTSGALTASSTGTTGSLTSYYPVTIALTH